MTKNDTNDSYLNIHLHICRLNQKKHKSYLIKQLISPSKEYNRDKKSLINFQDYSLLSIYKKSIEQSSSDMILLNPFFVIPSFSSFFIVEIVCMYSYVYTLTFRVHIYLQVKLSTS